MKVAIAVTNVLGFHYKVALDIAIKQIRRGHDVSLIICKDDLETCPTNPNHDWFRCTLCKSKLRSGLGIDEIKDANKKIVKPGKYRGEFDVPDFDDIAELKNFEINGVNHGMEAASSLISALRKPKPDMEEHRDLVENCLVTAVSLYRAALHYFEQMETDQLYVLNGRYATQRPYIRAAQQKDIKVFSWEIGHDSSKYILVEDTYFHDLDNKKNEIEEYWKDSVAEDKKREIASRFFEDRRYGSGSTYPEAKFKDGQRKGFCPDLDKKKHNIVIFNSSEDELAAVEGYENPVYEDQIFGIEKIIMDEKVDEDIHFYIRVHPNLKGVKNYQTSWIEEFDHRNVTVIPAGERIDSYALMEKCDKVLTFGSAMSIESAYAGKPSILVGREPYEDLGSCYTPESHREVVDLVNDFKLEPKSKDGAVKFGYYMVARDRDFDFFDPEKGTIMGKNIAPSRNLVRLYGLIKGNTKDMVMKNIKKKIFGVSE